MYNYRIFDKNVITILFRKGKYYVATYMNNTYVLYNAQPVSQHNYLNVVKTFGYDKDLVIANRIIANMSKRKIIAPRNINKIMNG